MSHHSLFLSFVPEGFREFLDTAWPRFDHRRLVCTAKQHERDENARRHGKTDSPAVRMHSGVVSCSAVQRIPTGSGDQLESRGGCIKRATFHVDAARTDGRTVRAVGSVAGQIRPSITASHQPARTSGRVFEDV